MVDNATPAQSLRDREDLPIAEIRRRFYPNITLEEEAFSVIWREIAGIFFVPPGLVRPTDRFGVELPARASLAGNDEDMFLGALLTRSEKTFGIEKIPDPETVNDLILYVSTQKTKPFMNR